MQKNRDLAALFFEMADLLELQGVEWKPNAYRKAARSIESLSEPIEDIYEKGGIKALKEISGVGQSIAEKIEEFLKTGRIKGFEKVEKAVPKGVEEMMHIPGLGPKKVMQLYKELKIKNASDLERAIKAKKLRVLKGFGEKTEEGIARGIDIVKEGARRTLLGTALLLARELMERLKRLSGVKKVEVAGSLRRMKETIGDIDLLVISSKPNIVMDAFTTLPEVKSVRAKGETKSTVILKDNIQADVRVLNEKSFGAALQYFTGSKEHNVAVRTIAIKKGFKLSEYGLFKNEKYVCGKTEQEIYAKLGMQYIPPEMRENQGEIEAAIARKIPRLVSLKDIKGDLQMHTAWSDGIHSIEEMARAAEQLGYKYIAITDHSKSEHVANGMDEKRVMKYLAEIEKVQKKVNIKILKGAEVSILKDGRLDYANEYLKKLDIVLAAIHSRFNASQTEMTKRITTALENPYVNILVHPTGRLINQRNPYDCDIERIMNVAKERNIALEIDAHPSRLDLNDAHVREAIKKGCILSIDTDSHAKEQLKYMELGVGIARRGWARPKNILNTLSLSKVEKFLRK